MTNLKCNTSVLQKFSVEKFKKTHNHFKQKRKKKYVCFFLLKKLSMDAWILLKHKEESYFQLPRYYQNDWYLCGFCF